MHNNICFFQPKVVWMKNKMEIREDPKFVCLVNQGVCSLEIRKPSPFDGGVYTCRAINSLGEATVDCKLSVIGKANMFTVKICLGPGSVAPSTCTRVAPSTFFADTTTYQMKVCQ